MFQGMSQLDKVYRRLLLTKFFTKGWGEHTKLKKIIAFRKILADRKRCYELVPSDYPIHITKEVEQGDMRVIDGHFTSPMKHYLPELVPSPLDVAHFQMLVPRESRCEVTPMCIHLAGTGDHYFARRRLLMAKPLLEEHGISSILLENPFYGLRRPPSQLRSSLHHVCDLFIMGGCLMLECLALLHWCSRSAYWPLGVSGVSMGGHMASLAACVWPQPLPLIPCLSWSTASCVFTKGVMSRAMDWELLEDQYYERFDEMEEIRHMFTPLHQSSSHAWMKYNEHVKSRAEGDDRRFQPADSTFVVSQPAPGGHHVQGVRSSRVEVVDFMRGLLDECTHLTNYTRPVDDTLIHVVAAEHDAYVPRQGVTDIEHLWPHATVSYIKQGHVAAFLFNHTVFRQSIADAFTKTVEKYGSERQKRDDGRYTPERTRKKRREEYD